MWYLRLNVKIFVLWPSGVFVLVHLHFSSHTLAHSRWTSVPTRLNLNWQCQESKILKKDFRSVIWARKKNRKKKDRNKCLWDLPREETPLPSGGSSLSSDLLKAAVFECLRIHLIHFFYNEVIVFQEKKNPCTCTWPNNIALLITSDPEIFRLCRAASTSLLSACSTSIWPLFT